MNGEAEAAGAPRPRSAARAVLLGAIAGLLYGVIGRLLALGVAEWLRISSFAVMTVSFLALVPMGMGWLAVRPHPAPGVAVRAFVPWLSVLACLAVAALLGWEGSICLVMGAPVMLVMSSIGGTLAGSRRHPPRHDAWLVLPLLLVPLESRWPGRTQVREVRVERDVHAPPAVAWREIVQVPAIREEERRPALFTALGFPRPVSATLAIEAVGEVRHARFEGGVLFEETVTALVPAERLEFTLRARSDLIPPSSLDPHVTLGGPFFDTLDGSYALQPREDGGTHVVLVSRHRLSTRFNAYASLWSDAILRSIQASILDVIAERAERAAREPARLAAGGPERDADAVTCSVTLDRPSYAIDERPSVSVRLCNASRRHLSLVGSVDGSERQDRVPWAWFTIEGSGPAIGWIEPGDGVLNPVRAEDVVSLAPGECFDPYAGPGRSPWPSQLLQSLRLPCAGDYVITFHYSTSAASLRAPSAEAAKLLRDVPAVDVECSAGLVVTEPVAKGPPLVVPSVLGRTEEEARSLLHARIPSEPPTPASGAMEGLERGLGGIGFLRETRADGRIWRIRARRNPVQRATVEGIDLHARKADLVRRFGSPSSRAIGEDGIEQTCSWLGRDPSYRVRFWTGCDVLASLEAFRPSLAPAGADAGSLSSR